MDTTSIVKGYLLKIALPILLVTLFSEMLFIPGNPINNALASTLKMIKAEQWINLRGGERKGLRGKKYFDRINFSVYDKQQGQDIKLKDFMMQHVTEFRPAIFLDLASDWEAITYWNLTDGVGDQNIIDSFGDSHVEVIMYNSMMYSDYFPTSIKVTTDMADLLNETRSSNNKLIGCCNSW